MDKGAILAAGTLAELVRIVGEKEIVEVSGEFSADAFSAIIRQSAGDGMEILSVADNQAHLAFADSERIPAMMQHLFQHHLPIADLKIKSPNLEAVFLKMTGRSLRD
jgi:ABC-2 type transport system ATP-binding protein